MNPADLRALADTLDAYHTRAEHKIAAAYLRACADAEPVAWIDRGILKWHIPNPHESVRMELLRGEHMLFTHPMPQEKT